MFLVDNDQLRFDKLGNTNTRMPFPASIIVLP